MRHRDPMSPVKVEEEVQLPKVWFACLGMVAIGIVAHVSLAVFSHGGMMIWPFVFAVCVLMLINDASSQNAVGVPPFQAYAFFFGTLFGVLIFVFLVSQTINPLVIVAGIIGISYFLLKDWKKRKQREQEIVRRRVAGLCVACCEPVPNDLEAICGNCGTPVNAERLNLFRLGRAIANKSQSVKTRQTLTGTAPTRADQHMQKLHLQKAARYKKK